MLCGVFFVSIDARAQEPGTAAIEGTVTLPKASLAPAAAGARYGISPTGQTPGAPDPPVAVVYLVGDFSGKPGAAHPPVQMAQHHTQFAPGVLPVQVGTAVEFPNLDDFYHNVFSFSPAKRFDLGRYRKDEKPVTQVFDKPGVVTLRCEIHESMRGTILVLDTPFFVKTDAGGRFRLEGLPTGRYVLKAWLNEKSTLERPVELNARSVTHVAFP